jgi:hypothetical protein
MARSSDSSSTRRFTRSRPPTPTPG